MSSRNIDGPGDRPGLRIAIIGVGLIGGSLAMAWRRSGIAADVVGFDPNGLADALRLGAIDRAADDIADAFAAADVIVLAAPVTAIITLAAAYAPLIRPGTVVTDVGSTKAEIIAAWERYLPEGVAFVGGHPMFGREVSGTANASADLPAGCRYALTPGQRATPAAVSLVTRLAEAAGGMVLVMTPDEHDRRVAISSHLPQIAATAVASAARAASATFAPGLFDLASTGFRDTTRLAESSADIWADIFATNRYPVLIAISHLRDALDRLATAIQYGDRQAIEAMFQEAHEARRIFKQEN